MEKLLITLTTRVRVEHNPNDVVRALDRSFNMRGKLWVLGKSGSRRALQGAQVAAFGTTDRFMKYAQAGLLYYEPEPDQAEQWAFAPGADAGTQLPVLLERYDTAFAKRSLAGLQEETKPKEPTLL